MSLAGGTADAVNTHSNCLRSNGGKQTRMIASSHCPTLSERVTFSRKESMILWKWSMFRVKLRSIWDFQVQPGHSESDGWPIGTGLGLMGVADRNWTGADGVAGRNWIGLMPEGLCSLGLITQTQSPWPQGSPTVLWWGAGKAVYDQPWLTNPGGSYQP